MRQITFNLTDEDFAKIEEMAKRERRTKASLIRHFVFKEIEEKEKEK